MLICVIHHLNLQLPDPFFGLSLGMRGCTTASLLLQECLLIFYFCEEVLLHMLLRGSERELLSQGLQVLIMLLLHRLEFFF